VTSVLDYIGRYLGGRFISMSYLKLHAGPGEAPAKEASAPMPIPMVLPSMNSRMAEAMQIRPPVATGPLCQECGSTMVPNGSCYKCENCGGTSGCS